MLAVAIVLASWWHRPRVPPPVQEVAVSEGDPEWIMAHPAGVSGPAAEDEGFVAVAPVVALGAGLAAIVTYYALIFCNDEDYALFWCYLGQICIKIGANLAS